MNATYTAKETKTDVPWYDDILNGISTPGPEPIQEISEEDVRNYLEEHFYFDLIECLNDN